MKKHSSLALKILAGFILLAVLICTAGTGLGYVQYKTYIQKQYNDTAYQIAEIFKDYMTEDEMLRYLRLAGQYKEGEIPEETLESERGTERYRQILGLLTQLRENTQVKDIYLAYLDKEEVYRYDGNAEQWDAMTYVFDSYIEPDQAFHFGSMGGLNPKYQRDAVKMIETGKRSESYFISRSEFGYNTSAILPIVAEEGTIGVIGVEAPMSTLRSALMDYVLHSILVMMAVTGGCLAIYMNYLYRSVVSPINLISREASKFVTEENQVSQLLAGIHTGDEIQTLGQSLLKLEIDINQYIENLTHVTAEKERISAELDVATQIQTDMLPGIFPAFPDKKEFDIYASMNPAKEVGGDFYDFFLVDQDHLALVIADVSGKGIPAALFMVIAKTLIKNETQMGKRPVEVVESVNNQLCENNEAEMFVTVWLGILQLSTGVLTAVNAGHEYPIVKSAAGQFELLKDPHGFVMGAMPEMCYEEYEIQLQKGDCLYIYTDGVLEAIDEDTNQFGEQRLLETLNQNLDASPITLIKHVKKKLNQFAGNAPQFDDITMLCINYSGPEKVRT